MRVNQCVVCLLMSSMSRLYGAGSCRHRFIGVCSKLVSYTNHLTLKMTSAQVVETSVNVTSNSPSQDYTHPDDRTLLYDL